VRSVGPISGCRPQMSVRGSVASLPHTLNGSKYSKTVFDPASFRLARIASVVGLVGEKSIRCPLGKIDQRVLALAVRRFAGREMEGDGPASGITGQ
jgi:hypothetical protein